MAIKSPVKLITDVKYSRRYYHHQIEDADGQIKYSSRFVADCLRWLKSEGVTEVILEAERYHSERRNHVTARINFNIEPTIRGKNDG